MQSNYRAPEAQRAMPHPLSLRLVGVNPKLGYLVNSQSADLENHCLEDGMAKL